MTAFLLLNFDHATGQDLQAFRILAQLLLGPHALGDLLLQFLGAPHGQSPWHKRHEGDDGSPGDDGREQLDQSRQTVRGPPEDDGFHQVRGAAGEDEGPEQPEDGTEWHVLLAQDKVDEDAGDGEVRGPHPQV